MYCPFPSKTIFSGKILSQLFCIFWWIVDTFSKIFRQNLSVRYKESDRQGILCSTCGFILS